MSEVDGSQRFYGGRGVAETIAPTSTMLTPHKIFKLTQRWLGGAAELRPPRPDRQTALKGVARWAGSGAGGGGGAGAGIGYGVGCSPQKQGGAH